MALHKPDPLNQDEGWELIQKIMGLDPKESSGYEQDRTEIISGRSDVYEKIKLGKEMMKVCNGLPLAIVVLGGILRKKRSLDDWKSVRDNISSYLRMGYDHGRSCMEILLQSYDDLPYHLKSCFLHLATFPEDFEIETESVYWMWVGEGLVTRLHGRTTGAKALEDVANDYMNDLAQVGLVEIVDSTSEGWIKSIRMHDLVRDVCIEKATADNYLKTMDFRLGPDNQSNTSDYNSSVRLLRLSIYLADRENNDDNAISDSLSSETHKYLRSLLFIPHRYEDNGERQQLMESICNEFQMLRVLVLDNMNVKGRLTSQVENLIHLRYLSLAGTRVTELPSSIGNLRFLEILDLRVCGELTIPKTLQKLFRLRHLLLAFFGYKIKGSERLQLDDLIWLETIVYLRVKSYRTKDLLKIKKLRKLTINDDVSEEEIIDIIAALKSVGRLGSCSLRVRGDVISKKPTILAGFVCYHELKIFGPISVPVVKVQFSQHLELLCLRNCQLEDDPMEILGSLSRLKSLSLYDGSYVGKKISCHSNSFPILTEFRIQDLENLEVWELEHGSMPMLDSLVIQSCNNLNMTPDDLPLSLETMRVYCNGKDQHHVISDCGVQIVDPYGFGDWLKDAVLEGEYKKVILWGNGGAGKATQAMELYRSYIVNTTFDVVARTCLPRRRCTDPSDGDHLPRRILQQLLRDLTPRKRRIESPLSEMSSKVLIAEIQQVLKDSKCLVILEEAEQHLLEDLDIMFGIKGNHEGFQSKLFITTESDLILHPAAAECHGLRVFKLRPSNYLQTWQMLWGEEWAYRETNAGIMWNMLRHCLGHPLSAKMLAGLLKIKENLIEWATKHEELTGSSPVVFSKIFELCYNDLPLHLRSCLIYIANFPEDVKVSTKKLYQMWIAAGFVRSKQDDGFFRSKHDEVFQTEGYLENLASSYLTELVQRGMVTVVEEVLTERAKTCRLKFALRDMCLEKAKEDHILTIVDQFEHTPSTSNAMLKTQQLAVHLDRNSLNPAYFDKLVSSDNSINFPTTLLIFPTVSDPKYNEEKWEWLLYICKYFQLLRVLDLERMWMTKGSLPKEVGNLWQLRYLSLRGTWVSELPLSIENLRNLQTLDLRVLESILIPNVLGKLNCLIHLYMPDFISKDNAKLQLRGLNCLQTLVNLQTDKVYLNDLRELKQLRKISIRKIHTLDVVDALDNILKLLGTSLDLSINSEIINRDQTILSRFKNLHKLKIKGMISDGLCPTMFPTHLEELTLKHTKIEEDPLPVLEELPKLRSLFLDHESFLGKTMTFSGDFHDRAILILCSLSCLEKLNTSKYYWRKSNKIVIKDCWRLTVEEPSRCLHT